jgi:hypothetical protein
MGPEIFLFGIVTGTIIAAPCYRMMSSFLLAFLSSTAGLLLLWLLLLLVWGGNPTWEWFRIVAGILATPAAIVSCMVGLVVEFTPRLSPIEYAGPPHCRNCDYNLKGLTEPRCPECGTPFPPSLLASNIEDDPKDAATAR